MGENGKNEKGDGRERRKKNLVFKDVRKVKEGSKEEIKNICKEIGVDIEIEEIRKVKMGREEKGDMLIVKVRSEENKRKILENKRKLKGRSVWIEEDLTFKERKMRWNLRRVAEEERRKGRTVRMGNGRIWVENAWWFWDEDDEVLRDGRERKWGVVAEGRREDEDK